MKTSTSVNSIAFNKVIELFKKRSAHLFILNPQLGKGYVQIFDLEKGLQVRLWNCCFRKEMELYNDVNCSNEDAYFNLAFFLNTEGLLYFNGDTWLDANNVWDTIFISNV